MSKPQLKPNNKYQQGRFIPKNIDKFVGRLDQLIYRSGLERKFMVYCDLSPKIQLWGYESHIVPYYNPLDKKQHNYIIDFWFQQDGKRFLVEIKPEYKLKKPVLQEQSTVKKMQSFNYEAADYIKNQLKWRFATEYAKKHNYQFIVLTEKDLQKI